MEENDLIDKQKRTRRFQIRFSEIEFEELKNFVTEHTNYKLSEFVREAIKDKKDQILNPIQSMNYQMPKELSESLEKITEMQKELHETVQNNQANIELIREMGENTERKNRDYKKYDTYNSRYLYI